MARDFQFYRGVLRTYLRGGSLALSKLALGASNRLLDTFIKEKHPVIVPINRTVAFPAGSCAS